MKNLSNISWVRLALMLGATAIIMLLMPHADRQSYKYELNPPWKYQILTAEFDMPIMRDSMSAAQLRDSIDANFVPFVNRNEEVGQKSITKFNNSLQGVSSASEIAVLSKLLKEAYNDGILDAKTFDRLKQHKSKTVRSLEK